MRRRRGPLLEAVGLADWGNTSVKKYSKGMLQRLGLAQAMLHDPQLLVLDEPTDGVDPVGRSEMRSSCCGLRRPGKTIFINSHLLQEVELVCDRVAILDHGQVLHQGQSADLTVRADAEVRIVVAGSEDEFARHSANAPRSTSVRWKPGSSRSGLKTKTSRSSMRRSTGCDGRAVSVISMLRDRQTLEEAFLAILERARSTRQ